MNSQKITKAQRKLGYFVYNLDKRNLVCQESTRGNLFWRYESFYFVIIIAYVLCESASTSDPKMKHALTDACVLSLQESSAIQVLF